MAFDAYLKIEESTARDRCQAQEWIEVYLTTTA
jgi:hypothetical protein